MLLCRYYSSSALTATESMQLPLQHLCTYHCSLSAVTTTDLLQKNNKPEHTANPLLYLQIVTKHYKTLLAFYLIVAIDVSFINRELCSVLLTLQNSSYIESGYL